MQRSFIALAAAFSLLGSAQARIGETEAQIRTRYGEAITVLPVHAGDPGLTKCYSAEGYIISVTCVNGHSVREILTKANHGRITEAEIHTTLKANASGSVWNAEQLAGPKSSTAGVREWRTNAQESRVAFYDAQNRALFITTQPFINLTNAPKRQIAVRGTAFGLGGQGRLSGRPARNMKLLDKGGVSRSRNDQPQPAATPGK